MSRLASGLLVLALMPAPALAAPSGHWVEQIWTSRDGLPQSYVRTILASRTGHLWLGTSEGLVRFDGQRFVRFDRASEPGLASNQIVSLLETPDGVLWIGTSRGVSILAGGTLRRTEELPVTRVLALARTPDGVLWAGGAPGGLVSLPGPSGKGQSVAEGSGRVTSLAVLPSGRILAGTDNGLLEVEAGRVVGRAVGLPSERVNVVLATQDGRVWAGTASGLARRGGDAKAFERIAAVGSRPVMSLLEASDGALWVGSSGGVTRIVGESVETVSADDDDFQGLAEDREGGIWAAASGLRRYRPRLVDGVDSRQGLSSDVVRAVLEAHDGTWWAGTENRGLDRIGHDGAKPFRTDLLGGHRVRALLEDRRGVLWVGTDGLGTYRFAADGREVGPFVPEARRTYDLLEDRDGTVWVGTSSGLRAVRGERNELVPVDPALPSAAVTSLAQAHDGKLLVGTEVGLAVVADGMLRPSPRYGGRGREGVSALLADPDGTVWIGTIGDGLMRWRGDELVSLHTNQGLGDDSVHAILDDGAGHLWLSGNLGIFRIARSEVDELAAGTRAQVTLLRVGLPEGMKDPECNGYGSPAGVRARDGRMGFATMGGVAWLDPSGSFRPLPPPIPSVEAFFVGGVATAPTGELTLPLGARRVEIRFAATSLTSPSTVRVRRQLIGLDEAPVALSAAAGSATFGPLRPGAYRFVLSAEHAGGTRSASEAYVNFTVPPFFWETPWFVIVMCTLALALVAAVLELRTRRLRQSEQALEVRVREALSTVKTLRGLLPICAWCKRVRDDEGYWRQIETFVTENSHAQFSHGLCPSCEAKIEEEEKDSKKMS